MEKQYKLKYLPLFYNDLEQKLWHIQFNLGNAEAAARLLDDVEAAILERLPYAESFEPYHSKNERRYPYYKIYVKNFVVYYVVYEENGENIMEVRRFLYNKQNTRKLL